MTKAAPNTVDQAFNNPTNNNAYGGSASGKAAWKQYSQMRQSSFRNKVVEQDSSLQPQSQTTDG